MNRRSVVCLLIAILTTACSTEESHSPSSQSVLPGLTCRLPVIAPTSSNEPPGGWITFPGGEFARDPESLPARLDTHVPSYDRQLSRWVPVEYRFVAPDGASYILQNEASLPQPHDFYLVDARNGSRTHVLSGDGPPQAPASWTVVEYAREGVYLWSTGMLTVPGLWLLDPKTGTVRLIEGSHYWEAVAVGAAWAVDTPADEATGTYRVSRLDLASGVVTTWYQGRTPVRLVSPTPDGDVLVSYGEYGSGRLALLSAPDQLAVVELSPDLPESFEVIDAFLGTPGVWLPLGGLGLALYQKGNGVQTMTRSVEVSLVAGGCV
jgi:hypothetical protein